MCLSFFLPTNPHAQGILEIFEAGYREAKGVEDVSNMTKDVLQTLARSAQKRRQEHLGNQREPAFQCSGQLYHPANFIEFVDKTRNKKDRFWTNFKSTYLTLPDDMQVAVKALKVKHPTHC